MKRPKSKTLTEVLEENRWRLLAVPGVVGVGRGKTEDGEDCVVILLREDDPRIRSQLPNELEHYPVRIKVTGKFEAFGNE